MAKSLYNSKLWQLKMPAPYTCRRGCCHSIEPLTDCPTPDRAGRVSSAKPAPAVIAGELAEAFRQGVDRSLAKQHAARLAERGLPIRSFVGRWRG